MHDIQYERRFSSIIYLYTLSIYHLCIYPSIHLPSVYPFIIYPHFYHLSINHLPIYHLSISSSIYLFICHLPVYPSFIVPDHRVQGLSLLGVSAGSWGLGG